MPALREAIAEHQRRFYGLEVPDVQVTMGATEAITAAVLGLCEPDDEVLAFDPTYDSYGAAAKMTGARLVPVPLHPPEWTFDPEELAAAVTPRRARSSSTRRTTRPGGCSTAPSCRSSPSCASSTT